MSLFAEVIPVDYFDEVNDWLVANDLTWTDKTVLAFLITKLVDQERDLKELRDQLNAIDEAENVSKYIDRQKSKLNQLTVRHYCQTNYKVKYTKCGEPKSMFDSIRVDEVTCAKCIRILLQTTKEVEKWEARLRILEN